MLIDDGQVPAADRFRDRRVLVTGASGFIGSNLVMRLLDLGAEVHGTLRAARSPWRIESFQGPFIAHRGDLADPDFVGPLFAEIRPDFVFHLAAYGSNQAQSDPQDIVRTNVIGTLNLLEAAVLNPPTRFIYAGTSSEYGAAEGVMYESSPTRPDSHYAITKLAGTHLCSLYARERGLKTLTLRFFTIYGPWMEPARLIPVVMSRGSRNEAVHLTAKSIKHDFLYIGDAVDAMLSACCREVPSGEVINLCTGRQTSNEEIVATVAEVMDREIDVVKGGYAEHSWDIQNWVGSNERALERLGWQPRHSLQEGLALTWAWMRDHPEMYGIDTTP